ncbi:putative SWIB/MDM2 and DEK domain protein [Paratrimastix pyriformis]|uniref:SWIB/MDM2 and DEK domain protein n=1 Tax=Paratrimastix pyriformis TaxID=342808 RepID=A0ABQ8UNX2_9EUKA|nr:putative SWIB/MDM2 and DEK domain protein [Paratrimastix pyriformis]
MEKPASEPAPPVAEAAATPAAPAAPAAPAPAADALPVPEEKLREAITELISGKDLTSLKIGEVRKQLEGKFDVDLSPWKNTTIKKIITEVVQTLSEENAAEIKPRTRKHAADRKKKEEEDEEEESSASESSASSSEEEAEKKKKKKAAKKRPAKKARKDDDDEEEASDSDEDKKKKKKKKPAKKTGGSGGGFSKIPMRLSPELAAVCGKQDIPRTQVVKLLWAYVKGNDLQNPKNKREWLLDGKLKAVFGERRTIDGFAMNRFLSDHLTRADGQPAKGKAKKAKAKAKDEDADEDADED